MDCIRVKDLCKSFTSQTKDIVIDHAERTTTTRSVLNQVNVDFPIGKISVILGRSGCGKSTLLNLLKEPGGADSGEIIKPEGWRAALLKPDPYVITWTSVFQNVSLAIGAGKKPEERAALAHELIRLVHLQEFEDLSPSELSTGMKQRLGLARVLGEQTPILLMDEPFAALDFITRGEMQDTLLQIQASMPRTVILVTHQLDEAVLLADEVYVMHADSTFRIFSLSDVPRPRNLDNPEIKKLRDEITAECRK